MRILLGLLCFGIVLFAQIGTVASLKGSAVVLRGNEIIPLTQGFALEPRDIVKTSKRSKAKIAFTDDTVVTLGQNSELNVRSYNDTPWKEEVNMHFVKGMFESVTGQIGKIAPKKFHITTSTSSIGIRGTTVVARVTTEKDTIACTDGAISVREHITNDTVIVPTGYFTTVSAGQKPAEPKKTDEQSDDAKKELLQIASSVDIIIAAENAADTLLLVETAEAPSLETGWGYWATDGRLYQTDADAFVSVDLATVAGYEVGGTATPAAVIDSYITSLASASYSGNIYGHITDQAGAMSHAEGNFLMDVDFGAASPLHLEMRFQNSGENWWMALDGGMVENSGFSINGKDAAYSFAKIAGGDVDAVNSADIQGDFYGSTGENVGATFSLEGVLGNGSVHTAQGVLVMP